jgi:phosphate-selective porin OprO/OprP
MKINKKIAVAVSGAVLLMTGQFALADSTTDIVDALVSKGVLTEEEGRLITKGHISKQEKTPVVKEKDGAFKLESANGNNSIQLTGRVHFDARAIDSKADASANLTDRDSATLADQFELRRARIGVKGTLAKHFDYEILTNLVGSSSNLIDVAYVNAGMVKPLQFRAGVFKQPFNLEEYGTSSNNIDFMERSYINQLTPAKKAGFMLHGVFDNGMTYAGSVYQQNTFGETDQDSTGKGFAGRGTVNFAQFFGNKEMVVHAGIAGFDSEYGVVPASSSSGNPNPTGATAYATNGTIFAMRTEGRGLANIYRAQITGTSTTNPAANTLSNSTSKINNKAYGLEGALAYKSLKIQGEYTGQKFEAVNAVNSGYFNADVSAGYIEALYMLTGENYADWYKNGAWGGIKPNREYNFDTGNGIGAWEVGLRYDTFDVNNVSKDSITTTGTRCQGSVDSSSSCNANVKTYTAGIKWQLNPNMRVLANYSHTKFDSAFSPVDLVTSQPINKEDMIMVRTQFNF